MSEKNRDNKNRWRNVTIAFRMSPEENAELDLRVKLCGYQTRQEYIIEKIAEEAEERGIKKKTLWNAKKELQIDSVKIGNKWFWMLQEE